MSTELILALIGLVAAPVSSALTAMLMRRKYKVEIEGLKAAVTQTETETRSTELDNVRKGSEILMEQIVTPLKTEMKSLRNELTRFRRAVEQIPACPHSAECPVSRELLADEAGGDGEPAVRK